MERQKVTPQEWYDKHGLKPDNEGWFQGVPECKKLSVDQTVWLENIAKNIQRDVPNAKACEYNPRTMVMVCGGPTAAQYLEEIRAKALDPAFDVFCSNKTGEWLLQNGIVPQYHMIIDSRKSKVKDVALTHPDVTYLLALNCDPDVFEALKDRKVLKFFCPSNIGGEELDRKEVDKYITEPMLMVCGGTMAGVRAITLAEGLGYRAIEFYGLDACIESKTKHYAYDKQHNEAILTVQAEDGREFLSTHIFADQVQQVMYWQRELPWVKITVHGDSFMSHMLKLNEAKNKRKHTLRVTPEYLEMQRQMHAKANYGISGHKHAKTVHSLAQQLAKKYGAVSVLDYGCGQSTLKRALDSYPPIPNLDWREYDPAIPGKDAEPEPADIVVCSDVLEHIEPDCLANVLDHLEALTKKLIFAWIDTDKAVKTLPDGRNAHISLHAPDWWYKKIKARFIIAESSVYERAVAFVGQSVALTKKEYFEPKPTALTEQILEVRKHDTSAKFFVVNDMTKYRVDSLFIKEPVTIDWINRMKSGEVLFDIGANVGSYTVWAGNRGVKVFAFEPASQNYDLLCRNIALNGLSGKVTAYCSALSDKFSLDNLFLSERSAGASCNELGDNVGPDLKPRRNPNVQGCIGFGLDFLVGGGHLPQPDHIKIDVDGFEHKVVAGAMNTIKKAKSLLIEINENLAPHRELVAMLLTQGFEFKTHQVDQARRLSGPFKGCAEYLFTKTENRDEIDGVIDRIMAAKLAEEPFPYLYLEEVFSKEFYEELLANLSVDFKPIGEVRGIGGYFERSVHHPQSEFWRKTDAMMRDGRLKSALCAKLGRYAPTFKDETLLIRDTKGYQIGPHTDSPNKVASALFYLPRDDSMPEAGTSVYVPKKHGVKCSGERHYFFEDFNRVRTMPYMPNSMFAFKKSEVSFHGVEKFNHPKDRYVLLYDVHVG